MRILYLIHAHESFSVGGAENAAFSLFREFQKQEEVETWILAAMHTSRGVLTHGELRNVEGTDREYLIGTSCDWFKFSNAHIPSMKRGLQRLLDHIQPDVIHLQHYSHFGIDVIPLLQSLSPKSKIVVTLHEYLALCMHNGQMVTTNQLKLCNKATPLACSMCFPQHSSQEMFLRAHYIRTILESCDALISPSEFLIQRYRDCGIDHRNFVMIENGLPAHFDESQRGRYQSTHSDKLNRFSFFGQLNIYKGPLIMLKAVNILQENGITDFIVNIHGANLEHQPKEFQDEFNACHEKVGDRVQLRGSYRQTDIEGLMLENDWVIMPSIWWENSPVVIQEAFFFGRPVISSDIGGIKEKTEGKGGINFSSSNSADLASVIEKCLGNKVLHKKMISEIQQPTTSMMCKNIHHDVYTSILDTHSSVRPLQSVT